MKKISIALLIPALSLVFFSCGNDENKTGNSETLQPNINLSGNFTNSAQEMLYLYYLPVSGEKKIDSIKLDESGNFKFENLHIPGAGFYTLKINSQQFCPLILKEKQDVKVTGDAKNLGYTYMVEGSEDTRVYQDITDISMEHKNTIDSLGMDFQSKLGPNMSKEGVNELSMKYEGIFNTLNDRFYKRLVDIFNANPNSLACIAAIGQLDPNLYISEYKKLDENLSKAYPDYQKITTFHEQVSKYSTLAIGTVAPDISMMDPNGKTFSLSSLRGKVVLIDFWASWCKPCLREVPSVVKLYSKYKNKGFEIFGVSLDENKDAWVNAISTNNMNWIQVCDFGGWYSPAAKNYDVTAIPYTVILDKEGRIVNKGLRGEQLEVKIKELLGQ